MIYDAWENAVTSWNQQKLSIIGRNGEPFLYDISDNFSRMKPPVVLRGKLRILFL